jgi:hypothetical protein
MTPSELRTLEQPIAALPSDEVPPALVARASAYNAAVSAFRASVRHALERAQSGGVIHERRAEALRACAADLLTAREWLLQMARNLPPAR